MIQLTWVASSVSTWPRLDLQVNYTATLCFTLFCSLNMDATYQTQVLMLTQQALYLLSHLPTPNTLLFITTQWFVLTGSQPASAEWNPRLVPQSSHSINTVTLNPKAGQHPKKSTAPLKGLLVYLFVFLILVVDPHWYSWGRGAMIRFRTQSFPRMDPLNVNQLQAASRSQITSPIPASCLTNLHHKRPGARNYRWPNTVRASI